MFDSKELQIDHTMRRLNAKVRKRVHLNRYETRLRLKSSRVGAWNSTIELVPKQHGPPCQVLPH